MKINKIEKYSQSADDYNYDEVRGISRIFIDVVQFLFYAEIPLKALISILKIRKLSNHQQLPLFLIIFRYLFTFHAELSH
jgi:hypothetical protein